MLVFAHDKGDYQRRASVRLFYSFDCPLNIEVKLVTLRVPPPPFTDRSQSQQLGTASSVWTDGSLPPARLTKRHLENVVRVIYFDQLTR